MNNAPFINILPCQRELFRPPSGREGDRVSGGRRIRAGWRCVRVQEGEKAKQKTRGDCLGLFVLSLHNNFEP